MHFLKNWVKLIGRPIFFELDEFVGLKVPLDAELAFILATILIDHFVFVEANRWYSIIRIKNNS